MIGAIVGDIVGSIYEFDNVSYKGFPLFSKESTFTDDTICTIAIADALVKGISFEESLRYWCLKYPTPMGCYGGSFSMWLQSGNSKPYYSYGNGSAMRVSPIGFACQSEPDTLRLAIESAQCTHNHPDGITGATVVALGIYRLRNMRSPSFDDECIESLMITAYGIDWENKLPPKGCFDETCQGCVPLAFHICKISNSFEDSIRNAIAYGGDSDTLGAIVGGLAESCFGVPKSIKRLAIERLPKEMINVIELFNEKFG